MPFLMVFFVVIMVLLLWKAGIPQAIIMLIIHIMFSTLGGMVAAVGVSAFATPIVGVPVGIVVFLMLMGKFYPGGNLNPILRTGMSHE